MKFSKDKENWLANPLDYFRIVEESFNVKWNAGSFILFLLQQNYFFKWSLISQQFLS